MKEKDIVRGLNLWMDAYIANPETFEAEFQMVIDHLNEREDGLEPSYGECGLALMKELLKGG